MGLITPEHPEAPEPADVEPRIMSVGGYRTHFGTFEADWDVQAQAGYIYVNDDRNLKVTHQTTLAANVIADYSDKILIGIEFIGGHA